MASLSLFACSDDNSLKTTSTPPVSSNVTNNILKLEVESDSTYEYVFVGCEYVPNVTVVAIYSDGKKVDVTKHVAFSEINTENAGDKVVTASYNNLSVQYTVKVLNPVVQSIELGYSNLKQNYQIGDTLDTTGLYVYANYQDYIRKIVDDYSILIYDSNNNLYNSTTFSLVGAYTVKVIYGTFQSQFIINVTNNNSNGTNNSVNNEVTTISLNTTNVRTNYFAGETLSLDNLVVNATYLNGTTQLLIIILMNYMIL